MRTFNTKGRSKVRQKERHLFLHKTNRRDVLMGPSSSTGGVKVNTECLVCPWTDRQKDGQPISQMLYVG